MVNIELIIAILAPVGAFIVFLAVYTKTPKHLRQRIRDREMEVEDWKHKWNKVRGEYNRMKKGEIVDQQFAENISKSENPADAVPDLLNNAAQFLPKQLSFIAKNPQIQGWLKTLAKEHPKEAKEFLAKYLPKVAEIATKEGTSVSRL